MREMDFLCDESIVGICNFRVTSDEALDMAKRLAKEEAIMGGISSGANVFAAVHVSGLITGH